ncbi:MAG: glycosyltransferase [Actinobacteria bacterium]|nr:glycosyltransferase [Actinomycetota bacterium]
MAASSRLAIAHDYLTQRGGAERVVLAIAAALPGALIYTSFYEPAETFAEFRALEVHTLPLNRVAPLRRHHRLALPFLAPAFSRLTIDADVVVCSSSGWAHGAHVTGKKIVYCHAPARWLYQGERYLGQSNRAVRSAVKALRSPLMRWDRRAALSADRYLANSAWIAQAIKRTYGIEAEVLPPPMTIDVTAPQQPVEGLEPGYFLAVSRLLPYKNVDAVVRAFEQMRGQRLVVVGEGPDELRLNHLSGENVHFAGRASDAQLRWLYSNAVGYVSASYEDFGLTPLEAAAFGKPTAALRFGGFLDTIVEEKTGLLFESPAPDEIVRSLQGLLRTRWIADDLRGHAASFSQERFSERLSEIVCKEQTNNSSRAA